jgi:anti-anti-sigma regulatory factor
MTQPTSAGYQILMPDYHESTRSMIMRVPSEISRLQDDGLITRIGQDLARSIEDPRPTRYGIDFTPVDYLSASFFGTLLTFNNRIRHRAPPQGALSERLGLIALRPEVYASFFEAGLNKVFNFYDSSAHFLQAASPVPKSS